jgi:hypothetical protein
MHPKGAEAKKMSVSNKLTKEIKGISMLVIIIVVFSIVLLKFKDMSGVTAGLNTSIDDAVIALQDPVSWIAIIVIIIVVAWLMTYLQGRKGKGL